MRNKLLKGFWRYMIPIPRKLWQGQTSKRAQKIKAAIGFMTMEHHKVRNFVVKELPRVGKSLSPEFVARELDLSEAKVKGILDELEKRLIFLFRDSQGAVVWAYPVTVEATPHHVTFSTGEQVYSA
jgi:hypothetical protein